MPALMWTDGLDAASGEKKEKYYLALNKMQGQNAEEVFRFVSDLHSL